MTKHLDSALERPQHRLHCDGGADLAALAAAYGFGLAQNHPFLDGKKRVAFQVCDEPDLAAWLRQHVTPR